MRYPEFFLHCLELFLSSLNFSYVLTRYNKEIFVGSGLCEVAGCLGLRNSENDVHNFEFFFSLVMLLPV